MRMGIEIKAISQIKESLVLVLKQVIEEIENGSVNMYLPLNDEYNTEADFSLVELNSLDLYDDWSECKSYEHKVMDQKKYKPLKGDFVDQVGIMVGRLVNLSYNDIQLEFSCGSKRWFAFHEVEAVG